MILVPVEVLDWPSGRQYIPAKESGLGNWIEVHAGIRDGAPHARLGTFGGQQNEDTPILEQGAASL